MFSSSFVDPADVHPDLNDLCSVITNTILAQTLGNIMCVGLVLDIELSRPIGNEDKHHSKGSSIPSIANKINKTHFFNNEKEKKHKSEKLYFRLKKCVFLFTFFLKL